MWRSPPRSSVGDGQRARARPRPLRLEQKAPSGSSRHLTGSRPSGRRVQRMRVCRSSRCVLRFGAGRAPPRGTGTKGGTGPPLLALRGSRELAVARRREETRVSRAARPGLGGVAPTGVEWEPRELGWLAGGGNREKSRRWSCPVYPTASRAARPRSGADLGGGGRFRVRALAEEGTAQRSHHCKNWAHEQAVDFHFDHLLRMCRHKRAPAGRSEGRICCTFQRDKWDLWTKLVSWWVQWCPSLGREPKCTYRLHIRCPKFGRSCGNR